MYEVLFNDPQKYYPELSEKLKGKEYLQLYPDTKAPHTCYLFINGDRLYVMGYYGLSSYYQSFDIYCFVSYIKNKENDPTDGM